MALSAALIGGETAYWSATQGPAAPGVLLSSSGARRAARLRQGEALLRRGEARARPAHDAVRASGQADLAAARKAAQQFVGETFFGLLLKELRKSTSKDHPLYGGRGEETMQPVLDQFLARRLAESRNFALADALAERLCRNVEQGEVGAAGGPAAAGGPERGPTGPRCALSLGAGEEEP